MLLGSTEWVEEHDKELRNMPSLTSTATATDAVIWKWKAPTRWNIW